MKKVKSIEGRSFVLNLLSILINISGLTLITMGFHESMENSKTTLLILGFLLFLIGTGGIILMEGKKMMSYFSRILVGSLFIVSGLIKANDPLGFSYKLEEYFEDGALAFRIKEWFGLPGFSLEFLIESALFLSVLICVLEIILGVLVIIGGKIKLSSWLLVLMMLFFTFLTWHTDNCDPTTKFVDRDTYSMSNPIAEAKIAEAKTNSDIKIVSKTSEKVVIDEMKQPQCVTDCGCFGDAMKGSVGRSLTPNESFWKDILLLYFGVWIFISRKQITPNTPKENFYIILLSMAFILFFSYIFGWYFPFLFGLISILLSLWILRSGGEILGNHWGSILIVALLSCLIAVYALLYEPIKDYRPYAFGSNLKEKMNDGIEGKYLNLLVYKNLKDGSTKEFDGSSEEYINSKIWELTDLWKYDTMVTKEIIPTKLPSITGQFNPMIPIQNLGVPEMNLEFIRQIIDEISIPGITLFDVANNTEIKVSLDEYSTADYDTLNYKFVGETSLTNPEVNEISIKDFIIESPEILILFSKNLSEGNFSNIELLKNMLKESQKKKIPFVMVCNASRDEINEFRNKHDFQIPTFINDETELKAIARSNPSLLILQDGVVKGKFPHRSFPNFDWISKNSLFPKK
jgi:uncharacterized membrane protein YphA (DoxX/SURF4 family)